MSLDAKEGECASLQRQAQWTIGSIKRDLLHLAEKWKGLILLVERQNASCTLIFTEKLLERKMTWCTHCLCIFSESESILAMFYTRETVSPHRLCFACFEEAKRKRLSGTEVRSARRNTLESFVGGSTEWSDEYFLVHLVEKHSDGYYVQKGGVSNKVENFYEATNTPPLELVEKFAEQLGLPPRLELKGEWPRFESELVVHQREVTEVSAGSAAM